jgi:hypothetical protein
LAGAFSKFRVVQKYCAKIDKISHSKSACKKYDSSIFRANFYITDANFYITDANFYVKLANFYITDANFYAKLANFYITDSSFAHKVYAGNINDASFCINNANFNVSNGILKAKLKVILVQIAISNAQSAA